MTDAWLDSFQEALANGDHDGRLDEIVVLTQKRKREGGIWEHIKELAYLREMFDNGIGQSAQSRAHTGGEINARLQALYGRTTNPVVRRLVDELRVDLMVHMLDIPLDHARATVARAAQTDVGSGGTLTSQSAASLSDSGAQS